MTNMTIEQFRQIYDDWKQSGLSVQQYCENTGLTGTQGSLQTCPSVPTSVPNK